MSRKNRQTPAPKTDEPLGDNWTSPFAGLHLDFPDEPPAPPPAPPPKPTPQEAALRALSKEDRELLRQFGGQTPDAPALNRAETHRPAERVSLSRERKGRGGKTVTLVRGLERMDTMRQMELCAAVKTELGIGGRFADGILELQGEQIDRAAAWFEKHGYTVKGRPGTQP